MSGIARIKDVLRKMGVPRAGADEEFLKLKKTSAQGVGFSAQGVPVTGFACGIPFVLPPGDGGANGLSFTGGGGGAFTMTAAILAGGWNLLTDCYVYLPANVGGSGNTAGWYYAQFSSDTVGTIYADQYVSGQPTIPAAPAVFPGSPSGRITTTTSEITANTGVTLPAGALGKNGVLEWWPRCVATNSAGAKQARLRIGGVEALLDQSTTLPDTERVMTVRNRGRLDRQSASRNGQGVGSAIATLTGDWLSIDTSVDQPVTMTLKLTATTDAVVLLASRIVVTNVG